MEKSRVVYSSAEKRKTPNINARKKKKPKLNPNTSLEDVAKIYLQNPRILPRGQIKALIRTGQNGKTKDRSNIMINKLIEQLERRDLENNVKEPEGSFKIKQPSSTSKERKTSQKKDLSLIVEEEFRPHIRIKQQLHTSLKYERPNYLSSLGHYATVKNKRKETYHMSSMETKFQSFHQKEDKIKEDSGRGENVLLLSRKNKEICKSAQSINSAKEIKTPKEIIPNKIFSINEKNELVSKFLLSQGWKQASVSSDYYTLKWTYNESLREYEILKNFSKKGKNLYKYFNHIQNNLLVTKSGFHTIGYKLLERGIRIHEFIPLTFELPQEKQQFMYEYEKTSVLVLVKKHISYLKTKIVLHEIQPEEPFNLIKVIQEKQYQKFLSHTQRNNTVVHLPLFLSLLIHCWNIFNSNEGQHSQQFDLYFKHILKDQSVFRMLMKYSRAELPFENYASQRVSDEKVKEKEEENYQMEGDKGYLRMNKPFMTPSSYLIGILLFFDKYFRKQFPSYNNTYNTNLWIAKPSAGSKGCGIQILQGLDQIQRTLEKQNRPRIIQKYIDNVWIMPSTWKNCIDELVGKKFDIRQWVLLSPPKAYIFSHFYIKICSKQYEKTFPNDPQAHISNYSVNKHNFVNSKQASVVSEDLFLQCLKSNSFQEKYIHLKRKIQSKLALLVEETLFHCEKIQGCFEIIGFDILIDQEFNPWIIEANMSPACQLRTEWLKQMRQEMTKCTLQIVMKESLAQRQVKESKYKWKQLPIRQMGRDHQKKQTFTVVGNKYEIFRRKSNSKEKQKK